MSTTRTFVLLGFSIALASLFALSAKADTLVLDSTQSYLTLEVVIINPDNPAEEEVIATAQLPGSETAFIGGTLEATVSGGNITFGGGSTLDFLEYDGGNTNLLPDVGGGTAGDPGTGAPADIGLNLDLGGLVSGPGAVRLAIGDITGGPEAITAGGFDAANLTLGLTAGSLDVNLDGFVQLADSVDISGNAGINADGGTGYTTIVNGLRYVVIPIALDVTIPVDVGLGQPLPITARFSGQLVTIPEPGSIAMLGVGLVGLVAVGARRYRRRK